MTDSSDFLNAECDKEDVQVFELDTVQGSHFSGYLYLPNERVTIKIVNSYEYQKSTDLETPKSFKASKIVKNLRTSDKSWYKIQLTHGKYEWCITRTMSDITSLHDIVVYQLRLRALLLLGKGPRVKLPEFPTKTDVLLGRKVDERKEMLENYLQCLVDSEMLRGTDAVISFFEISPVSFCERLGITKWREEAVNKLRSHSLLPLCCMTKLCRQQRWLVLKDTYLVYIKRTIQKPPSNTKQSLETGQSYKNSSLFGQINRHWRMCKVFLMDQTFAFVPKSQKKSRLYLLRLYNMHGRLAVLCSSESNLLAWSDTLTTVLRTNAAKDYVEENRFSSFAPPRPATRMTVLIDGALYMEAVAKAISQARHEIFITDWCMHPHIYLRRPVSGDTWRLDKLLEAKAKQGVRICIMLYAGVEGIVPFSARETCVYLHNLHPNIHIYLSPPVIMFWSHHEKMVAIDQSVVFMGGIDLCYGRWDTQDHRLEDVHKDTKVVQRQPSLPAVEPVVAKIPHNTSEAPKPPFYPHYGRSTSLGSGSARTHLKQRSSSARVPRPFPSRKKPVLNDRRRTTSEDSHGDIENAGHRKGHPQHRRLTHMFQRVGGRLHAMFSTSMSLNQAEQDLTFYEDSNSMFLQPNWMTEREVENCFLNLAYEDDRGLELEVKPREDLEKLSELASKCTWVGQDYVNWAEFEPNHKLHPARDLCERNETPRMPWHDIGCVLSGMIAADFSRHFIQRWNAIRNNRIRTAAKGTAEREKRRRKPLLLPSYPCSPWTETELRTILSDQRQTAVCQAQALRSVSHWSLGIPYGDEHLDKRHEFRKRIHGTEASVKEIKFGMESSIWTAYIDSILEAERFVFIENQFFVSFLMMSDACVESQLALASFSQAADETISTDSSSARMRLDGEPQLRKVKNRIVDALYFRILRAHREQKPFRVFIILPLIPGFVGLYGDPSARSQHKILHYTRFSLFMGENALIPRLQRHIPDPSQYVSVCGLRTWDEWPNGNLKTEIVYVHSKFMVVDDKRMIIGSANLNDRSMLGKRDSELAVLVEESPFTAKGLDHCPFIRRVRRSLMAEHLGVLPSLRRAVRGEWPDQMLDDPVCDEFYNDIWKATADRNAEIFEQVFNAIPSNDLKTYNDCKERRTKIPLYIVDPEKARTLLAQVRGTLVTFPDRFLENEDLTPRDATVEKVAPERIWT